WSGESQALRNFLRGSWTEPCVPRWPTRCLPRCGRCSKRRARSIQALQQACGCSTPDTIERGRGLPDGADDLVAELRELREAVPALGGEPLHDLVVLVRPALRLVQAPGLEQLHVVDPGDV